MNGHRFALGLTCVGMILGLMGGATAAGKETGVALGRSAFDLEREVDRIAAELRCPVCQNLSVADSPSELSQQIKGVIRERLLRGESREQVIAYFVSKYGEWVLLSPPKRGFNLIAWGLPFAAMLGGLAGILAAIRRWASHRQTSQSGPAVRAGGPPDPRYHERLTQELRDLGE